LALLVKLALLERVLRANGKSSIVTAFAARGRSNSEIGAVGETGAVGARPAREREDAQSLPHSRPGAAPTAKLALLVKLALLERVLRANGMRLNRYLIRGQGPLQQP
jgi:hypothetical protein